MTKCWLAFGTPTPSNPFAAAPLFGCLGDYKLLTLLQFAATTQLRPAQSERQSWLLAVGCDHGQHPAAAAFGPV